MKMMADQKSKTLSDARQALIRIAMQSLLDPLLPPPYGQLSWMYRHATFRESENIKTIVILERRETWATSDRV